MRPYLDGSDQSFWLTFEDGDAIGVVFVEPERMTAGTWNQLLVAVHPDRQGQGVGAQLLTAVERRVAQDLGGHLLLVETSADPAFDGTRRFYERLRYQRLAAIDDFYRPGEGKVIYGKRL
nr:GNAT family N-acetyltransferase [Sphingomonas arenae]